MTVDELKKALPKTKVFNIEFTDKVDYKKSKLGGSFYWPTENGPEMQFLAQINFEELPENDIFPKTGLLQFFVADDDSWGLFAENSHLVVYHENIDQGYELRKDWEDSPLEQTDLGMKFELSEDYLSYNDYRFDSDIELTDEMYEQLGGYGSKVLGYPAFTQFDPRDDNKYDTLLFQLDSEDGVMLWGDCGVANFFINGAKLKQHDFSDILYNWDCS